MLAPVLALAILSSLFPAPLPASLVPGPLEGTVWNLAIRIVVPVLTLWLQAILVVVDGGGGY